MSLAFKSQNEIIERVLHQCSKILYSDDREHTLIALHTGNLLRCNKDQHCFETKERQYGNALIIIYFCTSCGSCYGEVIPPREVSHQ